MILEKNPRAIRLLLSQENGAFQASQLLIHRIDILAIPSITVQKSIRKFYGIHPKSANRVTKEKPLAKKKQSSLKSRTQYEKKLAASFGHPPAERTALLGVLKHRPSFSIIIPVYNTDPKIIKATLRSLERQSYRHFEVFICNDNSTNEAFETVYQTLGDSLKEGTQIDSERPINGSIFVISRDETGGEARSLNTALASIRTSETMVVDPGSIFTPAALAEIVLAQSYNNGGRIFYYDTTPPKTKNENYVQPSFSIQTLCATDFMSSGLIVKTSDLKKIGGWNIKRTGVHRLDLLFRLYEKIGRKSFSRIGQSLVISPTKIQSPTGPRLRVVREFLLREARRSTPISALKVDLCKNNPNVFRLSPPAVEKDISIAVIFNLMDIKPNGQTLNTVLDSIFSEEMSPHTEVIFVCDETSIDHPYVKRLSKMELVSLCVRKEDENQNTALQRAVDSTETSVIGLINGNYTINGTDWLNLMVSWAMNPLVGASTASSTEHSGTPSDRSMCAAPILDTRFMFISRTCLEAVGGLDPNMVENLIDIDLGIRLWESGRNAINVPEVFISRPDNNSSSSAVQVTNIKQIKKIKNLWDTKLADHPQYFAELLPSET